MHHPTARTKGGAEIKPSDAILPILKRMPDKQLRLIGTAFYLTRYGLVVTAAHVIKELEESPNQLAPAYVAHLGAEKDVYLRKIIKAHYSTKADIAIFQADNYMDKVPDNPLSNMRPTLSFSLPREGEQLTTYGYPENKVLDFNDQQSPPVIHGEYFQGGFLRYVSEPEHPQMMTPYFESEVEVRSGASGGPVFDSLGRIVAINCRGWDFRGSEHEGSNLSYLVPIRYLLDLEIDLSMVPPQSWEASQIDHVENISLVQVRKLVDWGHFCVEK